MAIAVDEAAWRAMVGPPFGLARFHNVVCRRGYDDLRRRNS